tara:strand:- start:117 stop:464 length:348 start_codon:yes stop_codon:yes gene_type:complete
MSKIDTQGMSGPVDPNYKGSKSSGEYKPAIVNPRRLFTETYAKELKILINEVLDEREYKKRMAGPYDDVKPLPPSYFDTKHFQYRVGEEEPPYEDWRQPDFQVGLSPEYKPGYYQ